MPQYRLYYRRADDRISHALNIFSANDRTAIEDAIRIDRTATAEIWSGTRLVARIAPEQASVPDRPAILLPTIGN